VTLNSVRQTSQCTIHWLRKNYRAAHDIAVRQTLGQASTEDLRQAMIHYRTLFEDLVDEPEMARAKAAS